MTEVAILVDFDTYIEHDLVQQFVKERQNQAKFIMMISTPTDANDLFLEDDLNDWDAVIRNTGQLPNVAFKAAAFDVINSASSLRPVITLDTTPGLESMYKEGGVLITIEDI